jgi:hypothetical protein
VRATAPIAIFAYGSLASRESAARTLGRPVDDVVPARLEGWGRRWSLARDNLACEKTFARADDHSLPRFCLALNLERGRASDPNGALIEVSAEEVRRLDLRELRYDRIEVSAEIADPGRFEHIFAYVAKPEHHFPLVPDDAVVLASYVRAVEDAFTTLGPGELGIYRATTEACPVDVIEGTLVQDAIIPGNPREW